MGSASTPAVKRRVAVTGLGLMSCLGNDYPTVVEALQKGASGPLSVPANA